MPESPSSPQHDLQAILRKAEIQQKQLEVEARFKRNMAVFKETAPEIYHEYIDYCPTELCLSYTDEGYLNLINNNLENKPVYTSEPKAFCENQVEDYIKVPSVSRIRISGSKISNEAHIHVPLINGLIDTYNQMDATQKITPDRPIGLLLLTGCGLGYHIPKLIENLDIYNLCIFDPHKDSFYAALHTVDWEPIIRYFLRENRMFKLFVGVDTFDAMSNMKLLTDKIGLHNLVCTYIYRHFDSKKEQEFIDHYRKEFHLSASGTGFYDDEQVSFAHTIHNLRNRVNIFEHTQTNLTDLPPAIIIGNGPSLDKHIDFIKRNHKNAILISCGTALASIRKKGIKPDFHIEMERNIDVKDWLTISTSEEDRKGVTLLCLNTASPEVIKLFDEACIAKKPNDAGEGIIDDVLGEGTITALPLCNPTVTNAGLSYAFGMGFKEIYLAGVDLGMSPEGEHHSTLSAYHTLAKKTKKSGFSPMEDRSRNYDIKGNFCETVSTNLFLDGTRVNMEILINYYRQTKGGINVYNSNNGAFIKGAEPTYLEDIEDLSPIESKSNLIKKIKDKHFRQASDSDFSDQWVHERYLEHFEKIRKSIALPANIDTPEDMYKAINDIYFKVIKVRYTNPVTTMLLRGSMQGYFTLMMKGCFYQQDKKHFREAYKAGRKAYMTFLKKCYQCMSVDPLRLDDTHDLNLLALREDEENEEGKRTNN